METVETRLGQMERRLARAERRARTMGGLALTLVVGMVAWASMPKAVAQEYGATLAQLLKRMTVVENKTRYLSVSKGEMFITGANLHIVNGQGTTATANGLGNLIVGYNELRSVGNDRSGSHNIVVGAENNFSRFGGLVVGNSNTISGDYASVSGGSGNIASGANSSVSGGALNTASGANSWVSGGGFNAASGDNASVGGGTFNTASGFAAAVNGGSGRTVDTALGWGAGNLFQNGTEVFVSGANLHIVNGLGATNGDPHDPLFGAGVTNGLGNLIVGYNELRIDDFGNPSGNNRSGSHNIVVGQGHNFSSFGGLVVGFHNTISGRFASVSGGVRNTASGFAASVSGGNGNTASGFLASVSGGAGNRASGVAASVSGGGGITQSTDDGWSAGSEGATTLTSTNVRSP